jgi:type II secretory pathway pseudopilin PulG
MRRLARDERGISLPELLLSMVLMLIVLGATLATFTNFESDSARAAARNESQDAVRRNVGQMVRELRNLASPNATVPQAVERASLPPALPDLVFQTVDPVWPDGTSQNAGNVRRMRYCLESGSPARLWMQWQTWTASTPPAVPTDTACPGGGWTGQQVVAQGVTNGSRPVFTYDPPTATPTAISAVNVDLFVDMDPLRPPGETRLQSGAFLRNQNRAPTAAFAAPVAAGGKVTLNGSSSTDPEGQPLTYVWMVRTSAGIQKQFGSGITCECPTNAEAFPTGRLDPGSYTLWLIVTDPGGLSTTSAETPMEIK